MLYDIVASSAYSVCSNKQTSRLYVDFICKFNVQVIISGNYASNL